MPLTRAVPADQEQHRKRPSQQGRIKDPAHRGRSTFRYLLAGLRYPEIGSTLGISASAVGEFLRRALLRLRKVRDE